MTIGSDGLFSGQEVRAVERVVAGIVFPGAPGLNSVLGGLVQRRRKGHNRPHVRDRCSPIRPAACRFPAVRELSTAEWQRAHVMPTLVELARLVDIAPDSHDRVQPQQFDGHGGVGEINLSGAKRRDELPRQGLDIDLETHRQRRRPDRRSQ